MAYLDYLKSALSWHYFVGKGEEWQGVASAQIDKVIEAAKAAVTSHFYEYAPPEAMPYLLQNYNLDRIAAFSVAQMKQQVADAWDTWEKSGSEEGIIAEVERLGFSRVSLIPVWLYRHRSDGITDTLEFQPSLQPDPNRLFHPVSLLNNRNIATQGAWGSFEWWVPLNFHFSSFYVVIHDPPFAFRRWGDPDRWGPRRFWDALVTGDRVALQQLYQTIRKFTPAEWSCRGVVFSYSGRHKLSPVLLGVSVASTYDAWAVGTGGYSAHWDGTTWRQVQTGTTVTLFGVWTSGAETYATGAGGTILRWNGATWVPEVSGTFEILTGFAFAGPEKWACGQAGTILLNAGFGWSTFASPVATNLIKMFALSRHDIWAVGVGGVALHYDGISWTSTATGTTEDLFDVFGMTTNDVWAVGTNGTILHWNGAAWSPAVSPTMSNLFSITGSAQGLIAVGDEVVVNDGTGWKLGPSRLLGQRAWAVRGTVSDNYWIVTEQGEALNCQLGGAIYSGNIWGGFSWDDGTRYTLKYVIKHLKEKWE